MADVHLECEWRDCECKFESDKFQNFRTHLEDHLREILPGFTRHGCEDTAPNDFTCPWRECGWDAPTDTGELIRHVLFHAFHTKMKVAGHKKQLELKLSACNLGCQNRNVVPDSPVPFLCEWDGCISVEYNCPIAFYRHVEGHALAADDDVTGQGSKLIGCQWEGKLSSQGGITIFSLFVTKWSPIRCK